jgi:hypothetical protein
MIQARVRHGRLEVQNPIPEDWEGQLVKITRLTPDDPFPDLEERLADLEALGPMDFDPGERETIQQVWEQMNRLGQREMQQLAGRKS